MFRKTGWILFASLSILIGFYPVLYLFMDSGSGLLGSKSRELLADVIWNLAFYCHIIFGGIALLTGWSQFSKKVRAWNIRLHRTLGKIYVTAVLISALAGIYIGGFATGGLISAAGFISLGVIWFGTTLAAYRYIRSGNLPAHQRMMYFSFAATFAAVTLRLYLPFLTMLAGAFIPAYRIVAWLCWVPNLLVAAVLVNRLDKKEHASRKMTG
ncbi:MAG: DUF2306 domain-containing protein [Bacteroidetes bacterium]|nr:MAG: DUF2306 domain-containing protein [Bacteroidota bacterium]